MLFGVRRGLRACSTTKTQCPGLDSNSRDIAPSPVEDLGYERSPRWRGRTAFSNKEDGTATAAVQQVGVLELDVSAGLAQAANPGLAGGLVVAAQTRARDAQATLDGVIGAIYAYVNERYQELRFGSAVESAFEVVRRRVDARIADVVEDALPTIATAFSNAASEDPEQWRNAAAACRTLLKAAADHLYPPGAGSERAADV